MNAATQHQTSLVSVIPVTCRIHPKFARSFSRLLNSSEPTKRHDAFTRGRGIRCWWARADHRSVKPNAGSRDAAGWLRAALEDSVKSWPCNDQTDTTILEAVRSVRRLLRRIFFKMSLLNFISCPSCAVFINKSNGKCLDRHFAPRISVGLIALIYDTRLHCPTETRAVSAAYAV